MTSSCSSRTTVKSRSFIAAKTVTTVCLKQNKIIISIKIRLTGNRQPFHAVIFTNNAVLVFFFGLVPNLFAKNAQRAFFRVYSRRMQRILLRVKNRLALANLFLIRYLLKSGNNTSYAAIVGLMYSSIIFAITDSCSSSICEPVFVVVQMYSGILLDSKLVV